MNALVSSHLATPLPVSFKDICHAAEVLQHVAHRTPVLQSHTLERETHAKIYLKCENFQKVGAFKFRGAYYALSQLTAEQKSKGVVAFSSGNHAQAIALAGQMLGVQATVWMPKDAPLAKVQAVQEYGADTRFYDRYTDDRVALTQAFIQSTGATFISPYDDRMVIAGQGTAAKELFEEVGHLDYLFVSVGGGGFLAGSAIAAAHLSPQCQVIGVEPILGNDAQQSLRSGRLVAIKPPNTLADGAGTACIGDLGFQILQALACHIDTVSEEEIANNVLFLLQRMKLVVEPTGAMPLAAARQSLARIQGKRVGVLLSGGNIDLPVLARLATGALTGR